MAEFSDIDLNSLKVLATTLNLCSVSKAGRSLGVSQSAVSHALSRLRKAFGDELIVRVGNRMVATDRGQKLRPQLNRLLSELAGIIADPSPFDPHAGFNFTIACLPYCEIALIPSLLQWLQREAPQCRLRVETLDESKIEESLLAASFDLAIGRVFQELEGVKRRRVLVDEFVSCVRTGHPLTKKKQVSVKDFVHYPHIAVSVPGTGTGPTMIDRALQKQGEKRHVGLSVGDFLAAPLMVLDTDYILTSHRSMLEAMSKRLPLHLFPTPLQLPKLKVYMYWHSRDDNDAKNRWMRQLLKDSTVGRTLPLKSMENRS